MYDPKNQLPIENKVNNTPDPHQLIATDRIIEMARRLGISFGHGDPHERIRYFIKLGILPHAVRKSPSSQQSTINNQQSIHTSGHLPYWTLKRLIVIDRLKRSGASFQQIAEKFKRIDNLKAKEQSAHDQQLKPGLDNRSAIKNTLQSSLALWGNSGLSEEKIEEKLKIHKLEIDKKLQSHKVEIRKELGIINELTDTKDITKSLTESELNTITGYQNYLKKDPQPYEPDPKTLETISQNLSEPLEEKTFADDLSINNQQSTITYHPHTKYKILNTKYSLVFATLLIFFIVTGILQSPSVKQALDKSNLDSANKIASETSQNAEKLGAVLAASSEANKLYIDATTEFLGETTFIDPITAPNIIYGITGGTGITVSTGQNPTVSLDSTEIVTTLNSTSGALTIAGSGGTSISTSGSTITISSSSSSSGDITAVNAGNGLTGGASSGDASLAISLTSSGTSTTTSSASGLQFSSGLSLLRGCSNTQTLQWIAATATWDCATGGGSSSFTLSGDSGSDQTISSSDTLEVAGGTNGIDTVAGATDTVTLNLDTTEIGTTTFGSGSSVVWTFNTGTVDPTIDFNDGSVIFNEGGSDIDLRVEGDNNANLFTLDAGLFSGVGQISLGAAAQSTATAFFVVDNPATTATSNQNFYKTYIDNNAAVTISGATTSSIVASMAIDEPNITATGTVTNASTLYVSGAPTEGSSGNFALWVDDGQSRFENTPVSGSTSGNAVTVVPTYVVEVTDITLSGIRLALDGNSNADSGDVFYGFNADDFTTTSGPTEYGVRIGSGYDYQFYFELGTRDLRISATAPSAGTSPLTATIPALAADDTFCLSTLANCFGAGGGSGVTYTSQVTNALTKFTSTTGQITSSGITDDGTTLTLPANRSLTLTAGTGSITENFSPAGTTGTARALTITPTFGIDVTDQTLTGVYVNPNTNSNLDGGDVLNGVLIDTITASSATEYGLQIGSGYDQNIYFNDTTTNLLLADGGTITISDGTNTLCTLTDAGTTGNLSCTGNLTGGSGGTVGFWTRSSTFIYPSTTTDDLVVGDSTVAGASLFFDESAGTLSLGTDAVLNGSITLYSSGASETDPTIAANSSGNLTLTAATGIITLGGSGTGDITLDPGANNLLANLSSTGDFLIQDAGTAYVTFSDTGTTVFDFTGTTTVGVTVNANSLTSGTALALASTATAFNGELLTLSKTATTGSTAFTSDITNVTYSQTFNATVASASTGNVLDISRAYTVDDSTAGAISATISGAVVTISDNCTQGTADTCTNSANVLTLTQSYASASGAVLSITGSGTGSTISATGNSVTTGSGISGTFNGLTTGTGLDISSTGTITTTGELAAFTANSLTTGALLRLSATALSSGTAIEFTGPSATGITGNVISLTSDVGSAGELINLAPDFPGAGVTAQGVTLAGTDSTSSTNTDYGYYTTLTLTGNAAKTGVGYYGTVTSSSTTADTLATFDAATSVTGVISSGTRSVYGLRSQPAIAAANTAGTSNLYGGYFVPSSTTATTGSTNNVYGAFIDGTATLTTGGTITSYGLYIGNASMDATGTSTQYGLYIEDITGADTNIELNLASTTPTIAIGNTGTLALTDGTNTLVSFADDSSPGNEGKLLLHGNDGSAQTVSIEYEDGGSANEYMQFNNASSAAFIKYSFRDCCNAIFDIESRAGSSIDDMSSFNYNVGIKGNDVDTEDGLGIAVSSLTTGSGVDVVGPTSTGITGSASGLLSLISDVGSAGTAGQLAYLAPDFSAGSATTGYGVRIAATDSTAIANTDYGYYAALTLTGNAAKTGVGYYGTVTSSSTTADTLISLDLATTQSGASTSGTKNVYGLRNQPTTTGANTSTAVINLYGNYLNPSSTTSTTATVNNFGEYITGTATVTGAGIVNRYGVYVANATMDTTGTSTQYGLYVEDTTGADTNIEVNLASTSPTIAIGGGGTLAFTDGTNTLCSIADAGTTGNFSCTGSISGPTTGTVGYWTRGATFVYPATTTDDLVIGDTTAAAASLFFDESAGTLFLGTDAVLNGSITLYSSGTETDPTITAEADGDLTLSAATGTVNVGSGTGDITLDPGANNVLVNLSSTGDFLVQDAGTAYVTFSDTGTTVFDFTGTTTVGVTVNANSLTSGTALALASTATAFNGELLTLSKTATTGSTAFTSDITNVTYSQTFNATVASASTGNVLDISRAYTVDDSTAGAISATISGAVVTISDNCTQGTADTCTNSANVLALTQSYASASGAVLAITGSGTGSTISATGNSVTTGSGISGTFNGLTTGTGLDISSTGTIATTGELAAFTANSLTTGALLRLSATSLSSGTAIEFTGPTATGITGNVISLTSDVGSAGELINLTPDFPGAGVTAQGVTLAGTDSTSSTNTDYGYYTTLTLTGNAAKTGVGYYGTVTSSSTTNDTLVVYDAATSVTGIISAATTRNVYGLRSQPAIAAANSAGTSNIFGSYIAGSSTTATTGSTNNVYGTYVSNTATVAAASTGTINNYGVYIANGTSDTVGTSSKYGLYIADQTGADRNEEIRLASTSPTIAMTNAGTLTFTDGTNSLFDITDGGTDTDINIWGNSGSAQSITLQYQDGAGSDAWLRTIIPVSTARLFEVMEASGANSALIVGGSTFGNSFRYELTVGASGVITTSDVLTLTSDGLTTGSALVATGPTSTGVTDHFVKLASDVGSATALVNLAPDFSGSAVTAYGLRIAATDATANANTDYGISNTLTLTGNIGKTGYGYYGTVTSSSTTADTIISMDLAATQSGASTSGTKNVYGLRNQPTTTGANTSTAIVNLYGNYINPSTTTSTTATVNNYGEYIGGTATVTGAGIANRYGVYIANASMDATGTSTQYGLYIANVSGADTNYPVYIPIGENQEITIVPSITAASITSDVIDITIANDATNNFSGNVIKIDQADTGGSSNGDGIDVTMRGPGNALDLTSTGTGGTGDIILLSAACTACTTANAIFLDQTGGGTITNGIQIGSGTAAITNAINIGSTGVTTDISLQNAETIDNNTNGQINLNTGTAATGDGIYLDSGATTSTAFGLCHSGADADNAVFADRQIVACSGAVDGDYAEAYPVERGTNYGDVMVLGNRLVTLDNGQVIPQLIKSSSPYQQSLVGVVSDNTGDFTSAGNNVPKEENPKPIALVGRVPVKVTAENGPIAEGDYLTTSSTPGYAMKATTAGPTIGMALGSFNGDFGTVMVFVKATYYMGSALALDEWSILSNQSLSQSEQLNQEATDLHALLAEDIQKAETLLAELENKNVPTEEEITSLVKNEVNKQLISLGYVDYEATGSAQTTSSSALAAQTSKTLADLDALLQTTNYNLPTLTVTGNSQLAQTQVAGTLSQDGTLIIDYGRQINVLGSTLFLQNDPYAGDCGIQGDSLSLSKGGSLNSCLLVDIGAGKLTIDQKGNLVASGNIETKGIVLSESINNSTIGSSQIPTGSSSITIETSALKPGAKVLVTATGPTGSKSLYLAEKSDYVSFTVAIENGPATTNINFDWLIVNTTQVSQSQ